MGCSLFTGTKINLRYTQTEERDVVRDSYFIAAMWRLLGTKIRASRRDEGNQMALINAVYGPAGQPLERVLDARQVAPADKRIPLAQTTLRGAACSFEPVATQGECTSWVRYATHFTAMATDLNPTTTWQIEVYAEYLKAYAAGSEAYRQRAEGPRERMEPEFQNARARSKDFESRGVGWRPKEIWYAICVADCVLSKDPSNLLGYRRLAFDKDIQYDEISSSDERGVDASNAAKASRSSATTTKPQAKGPQGKTATHVGHSVTPGFLVAESSSTKPTTMPGSRPRCSPSTTGLETSVSSANALSTSRSAKGPSKVAKARAAKGTLTKATPTPTRSIVRIPLPSGSTLRKLSASKSSDSSPTKTGRVDNEENQPE